MYYKIFTVMPSNSYGNTNLIQKFEAFNIIDQRSLINSALDKISATG